MPNQFKDKYIRLAEVCEKFSISPSTVWRKVKDGSFVKPHKLSHGVTAWKNSELNKWEQNPLNYKAKS